MFCIGCLGLDVTPRSLVVLEVVEETQDAQDYREEGLGRRKNRNGLRDVQRLIKLRRGKDNMD